MNTVNGARVTLEDGAWVLVRASSNKPELVVVVESMTSDDDMRALFREEVKPRLARFPKSAPTIRRFELAMESRRPDGRASERCDAGHHVGAREHSMPAQLRSIGATTDFTLSVT